MAASTAERPVIQRGIQRFFPNVPMAAVKIYAGCVVGISSAGYAGLLSDTTYTKAIGVATKTVDNTAGSAGDLTIDVARGEFFLDNDGTNALTIAHVGPLLAGLVEWSDDHTAANATDTGSAVGGTLVEVVAADTSKGLDAGVWIEFP